MNLYSSKLTTALLIISLVTIVIFDVIGSFHDVSSSEIYGVIHEIIGSPVEDLYDYQVRVVIRYGSGVSRDDTFYCNYRCRPDFGDVRFILINNSMPLPYWAESIAYGDYAVFWIRVPYIPKYPGRVAILVTYGDQNRKYEGRIQDVFIDADDFTTPTLHEYKLVGARWELDASKGLLKSINNTIDGGCIVKLTQPLSRNVAIRARVYVNYSDVGVGFLWYTQEPTSEHKLIGYIADYHPIDVAWSSLRRYDGIYWWHTLMSLPSPEQGWHVIELRVTPTWISVYRNDKLDAKVEDTTYNVLHGIGIRQHANNSIAVDWWVLRKYVEPEPEHGAWFSPLYIYIDAVTETKTVTHTITQTATLTITQTAPHKLWLLVAGVTTIALSFIYYIAKKYLS